MDFIGGQQSFYGGESRIHAARPSFQINDENAQVGARSNLKRSVTTGLGGIKSKNKQSFPRKALQTIGESAQNIARSGLGETNPLQSQDPFSKQRKALGDLTFSSRLNRDRVAESNKQDKGKILHKKISNSIKQEAGPSSKILSLSEKASVTVIEKRVRSPERSAGRGFDSEHSWQERLSSAKPDMIVTVQIEDNQAQIEQIMRKKRIKKSLAKLSDHAYQMTSFVDNNSNQHANEILGGIRGHCGRSISYVENCKGRNEDFCPPSVKPTTHLDAEVDGLLSDIEEEEHSTLC